jgi:hypothetical protein
LDVGPGSMTPGNIIRNHAGVRLGSKWTWNNEEYFEGSNRFAVDRLAVPASWST